MSCRTRVSTPARGPLDVRDCSTCGRSAWFPGSHLYCDLVDEFTSGEADSPTHQAAVAWESKQKMGRDGFPAGPTTNCPAWVPAWSE